MTRVAVVSALLIGLLACTGADAPGPDHTADAVTDDGLIGPLCPVLPKGDEPGNPTFLRDLQPAEALTWNPVLTVFEALSRASGVGETLASAAGVTILAPSDDTINATLDETTLDALILQRTDEAATLLQAHIIDESLSLEQFADRDTVTTRAGTTIAIGRADGPVTFDGAGVLCGDYTTAGGRIHLIDRVLGALPAPEPEGVEGQG